MHNSFTIIQDNLEFQAVSHNFPTITGHGYSEKEAFQDMVRKLNYMKDNEPLVYKHWVDRRKQQNVHCLCGWRDSQTSTSGMKILS